ncbi:MAG TPA: hypothetical protein VFW07_03735 [Parafilimonas sp.]|nr:hypothetical protein [Parafilimonas sp.]
MKRLVTLLTVLFVVATFRNFSFAGDHQITSSITAGGIVKEEDGNPLMGVTIAEKGKNNSVKNNCLSPIIILIKFSKMFYN